LLAAKGEHAATLFVLEVATLAAAVRKRNTLGIIDCDSNRCFYNFHHSRFRSQGFLDIVAVRAFQGNEMSGSAK